MKTLVAYFSKGGRTKKAAERIAELVGGDLYEIKTEKQYPKNYFKTLAVSKAEFSKNEYPQLKEIPDVNGYDRILIGFPIWFGTCPMAVLSFMGGIELNGKTIYPFCTSGASGCDKAASDILSAVSDADIRAGYKANKVSAEMTQKWLEE